MPAGYTKIRDALIRKGKSVKAAKTMAAKIYNAKRRDNPSLPKLTNKGD